MQSANVDAAVFTGREAMSNVLNGMHQTTMNSVRNIR